MTLELFMDMIYCFIASWFFARIMRAPKQAIFPSCVIASVGYVFYILFGQWGNPRMGYFVGTLAIALWGEYYARKFQMPSTIFIFPGVVPIVPGYGLYQTLSALVGDDFFQALKLGANAMLNIGAMSIAIALVGFIAPKIPRRPKATAGE